MQINAICCLVQVNLNRCILVKQILSCKVEKFLPILGILIVHKLRFDQHVSCLSIKAGQKQHALPRIAFFMNVKKRKLIINAFISSQFGYCPLVWMFHSRELNNRINRIH